MNYKQNTYKKNCKAGEVFAEASSNVHVGSNLSSTSLRRPPTTLVALLPKYTSSVVNDVVYSDLELVICQRKAAGYYCYCDDTLNAHRRSPTMRLIKPHEINMKLMTQKTSFIYSSLVSVSKNIWSRTSVEKVIASALKCFDGRIIA